MTNNKTEHENIEKNFKIKILTLASGSEFLIESMISAMLTNDIKRMKDLKLILLNQSELSLQFKIDSFEKILKKYQGDLIDEELLKELRDLRKMRNKVAHYMGPGTAALKKDVDNKRIRLRVYDGFDLKEEFYTFDQCKTMIEKYKNTINKLSKLTVRVMSRALPSNWNKIISEQLDSPEYKHLQDYLS